MYLYSSTTVAIVYAMQLSTFHSTFNSAAAVKHKTFLLILKCKISWQSWAYVRNSGLLIFVDRLYLQINYLSNVATIEGHTPGSWKCGW